MIDLKDRVHELSADIPSRDVGGRGEELASETLADDLYRLGLQTDIDGFACPGNLRISRSIYFALLLVASLLCFLVPGVRIVALILGIIALVLLFMSYAKVDPLGSMISKYESQNVIARYVPQGLINSSKRSKIVITAHYDVQKPSLFQMPFLRKFYPIIRMVVICAAIAIPVCCLLTILPLPDILKTIFSIIALVGGVIMLIAIIDQLIGTFMKAPKGANNNASGLAVMMALAEKVSTAEVRVSVPNDNAEPVRASRRPDDEEGIGAPVIEDVEAKNDFDEPRAKKRHGGKSQGRRSEGRKKEDRNTEERRRRIPEGEEEQAPVRARRSDDPFANAAKMASEMEGERGVGVDPNSTARVQAVGVVQEPESSREYAQEQQPQQSELVFETQPPVRQESKKPENEPISYASRTNDYKVMTRDESARRTPRETKVAPTVAAAAAVAATAAPAVAAKASSRKQPSWWAKVEDEKSRGELGETPAPSTLRSRFADAPANKDEEPVNIEEAAPEAAPEEAQVEEVKTEPVQFEAPQETPEAAPVQSEQIRFDAPEEEQATPVVPEARVEPEAQASTPEDMSDPNHTVAYMPEPLTPDMVASGHKQTRQQPTEEEDRLAALNSVSAVEAPEPEEAPDPNTTSEMLKPISKEGPLRAPDDAQQSDWPTGAYKYSREKYVPSDSPAQEPVVSGGYVEDAPQPEPVAEYSRSNYMNGSNHGQASASTQTSDSQDEVPSWLRSSVDGDTVTSSYESAAPAAVDEPTRQVASPDATADVRGSLLNLPVVGSMDTDISLGDGYLQKGLEMDIDAKDDTFITREDVLADQSGANLTGSFAPLGATGTMKPVTSEMLEQYNDGKDIYIDDADDSSYDVQYGADGSFVGAMPIEAPKKKRFSLFGRKDKSKKKGGQSEGSPSEWLGLDEDYNATDEGAEIGSWDNFDDDDSDWNGGAYGAPTSEGNRDAVEALSDELLNKEVWFVALGASGAGDYGIRNLLKTRASELRHSRIINLEGIGAGDLSYTASEPVLLSKRRTDPRLQKLISKAAHAARVDVEPIELDWRTTEATPAIDLGAHAISIIATEGKTTPGWRWGDDTDDMVSEENLQNVYRLMIELVKNS